MYLAVRLLLRGASASGWHWAVFTSTGLVYAFCWWSIKTALCELALLPPAWAPLLSLGKACLPPPASHRTLPPVHASSAPAYNAAGELVYAGQDLKTGGALSYFHDVVYVGIFAQVRLLGWGKVAAQAGKSTLPEAALPFPPQLGGALSDWVLLAWLAVPAYAAFALVKHVLIPYW